MQGENLMVQLRSNGRVIDTKTVTQPKNEISSTNEVVFTIRDQDLSGAELRAFLKKSDDDDEN
jgi:hypothetical protein